VRRIQINDPFPRKLTRCVHSPSPLTFLQSKIEGGVRTSRVSARPCVAVFSEAFVLGEESSVSVGCGVWCEVYSVF
jgi:hypothetical protein